MNSIISRRAFISSAAALAGATAAGCYNSERANILVQRHSSATGAPSGSVKFRISLAQWSYHRALFGGTAPKMDHLDFPVVARKRHGIEAVELVNQFMMTKAGDAAYLRELRNRADGEGVRILLIMCDGEGSLGDSDAAKRKTAVSNHHKWADAAKTLGGHSIRVNAATGNVGSFEDQQKRAAEGLSLLGDYCAHLRLNCIVENHGGLSSNGGWLAGVMRLVNKPNVGTLPDFGNFALGDGTWYDRYLGVEEMMPYAKAVSAKSNAFDSAGNCVETDYNRMLKIVLKHGYHGWIGIEYEGDALPEAEGIRLTKELLERVRNEV